jgi:hypothetical protein
MAACTKSLKVFLGMSTAFAERQLVVNFLSRDISPVLKAEFTEGMLGYVQASDGAPVSIINGVGVGIQLVLSVAAAVKSGVKIAITAAGQSGTTGILAGFRVFVGHR